MDNVLRYRRAQTDLTIITRKDPWTDRLPFGLSYILRSVLGCVRVVQHWRAVFNLIYLLCLWSFSHYIPFHRRPLESLTLRHLVILWKNVTLGNTLDDARPLANWGWSCLLYLGQHKPKYSGQNAMIPSESKVVTLCSCINRWNFNNFTFLTLYFDIIMLFTFRKE